MNHLSYFSDKGLTVSSIENGDLKIQGLSSLPGNLRSQVLEYAKSYKQQILFEIKMQDNTIHEGRCTLFCPARCKQTGKCYGIAYFDAKPGKALLCIPEQCPWSDQLKLHFNRKER